VRSPVVMFPSYWTSQHWLFSALKWTPASLRNYWSPNLSLWANNSNQLNGVAGKESNPPKRVLSKTEKPCSSGALSQDRPTLAISTRNFFAPLRTHTVETCIWYKMSPYSASVWQRDWN